MQKLAAFTYVTSTIGMKIITAAKNQQNPW